MLEWRGVIHGVGSARHPLQHRFRAEPKGHSCSSFHARYPRCIGGVRRVPGDCVVLAPRWWCGVGERQLLIVIVVALQAQVDGFYASVRGVQVLHRERRAHGQKRK